MLLFFSVARSASQGQADRAAEASSATGTPLAAGIALDASDEAMPTDKLVDISALALRMSSPFNASYWRAAA